MSFRSTAALATAILTSTAVQAHAADIVVFGTVAAKNALQQIVPAYEKATGNKVTLRLATAGELKKAILDGAAVDVAILTNGALDDLAEQGKLDASSKVVVAKSGLGVAVKKGAPLPPIATGAEFTQTLLKAKSIAYTAQGASNTQIQKVFAHYKVSAEMMDKTVLIEKGTAPEAVGRGEAELGFTQISEILDAPGAQLAGPVPADAQIYLTFAAELGTGSKEQAAAKAFMAALTTAEAKAALKKAGLEPG